MDNEIKNDLVKYRIEKAKETLNTAEKILEDIKDYSSANNRHIMPYFMLLEQFWQWKK